MYSRQCGSRDRRDCAEKRCCKSSLVSQVSTCILVDCTLTALVQIEKGNLKLLDKDGDGKVDRNEFTRHLLLELGKITEQDLRDVDAR